MGDGGGMAVPIGADSVQAVRGSITGKASAPAMSARMVGGDETIDEPHSAELRCNSELQRVERAEALIGAITEYQFPRHEQ